MNYFIHFGFNQFDFIMGACLNENPGGRGQRKIKFGDYKLTKQEIIANGAYGDIWKCKSHSGQIFALK